MPVHTRYLFRSIMLACILALAAVSATAHAGIVTSSEIVDAQQTALDREQIRELLSREDIQRALAAQGVDPVLAQQRVEGMTTAEMQLIAAHMDQLPAGGALSTIEWLLIIIIIILLI